jgi:hypothetical protein
VTIAVLVVFVAMMVIGIVAFFSTLWTGLSASPFDSPAIYLHGIGRTLLGLLVCLVLLMLISMAAWFAPALIVLHGVAPVDALRASFWACQRHFLALLVYGIVWVLLVIVCFLTLGLGFLFLAPWMFLSTYAAFVDMFGEATG